MLIGKNKRKMGKKALCLTFAFLLSINSFAAIVSDNDGSSFVTKAEFEGMKKEFAMQIDTYNSSLDKKIDGSIASYLAGINLAKKREFKLDRNAGYKLPIYMDTGNDLWNDPGSKYYDLSVPRTNVRKVELWDEHYWKPNVIWNTGTGAGSMTRGNAGNNINSVARLGCIETNWTYDGKYGHNNIVENSSDYREVGGTSYQCFTRTDFGRYKLNVWYNPDIIYGTGLQDSGPYAGAATGCYNYTYIMGIISPKGSDGKASTWSLTNKSPWTPSQFYGGGWGNSRASYDKMIEASNMKKYNSLDYAGGWKMENDWGAPNIKVDSWEDMNHTHWAYAKAANCQASANQRWSYLAYASSSSGADTNISQGFVTKGGYTWCALANWSGSNKSVQNFMAWRYWVMPYWYANANSTFRPTLTSNFSQLPASLVQYTDEFGARHYLDEGLYLTTMEGEGECEFAVKFITDIGEKNLKFYASLKPFTSSITPNDYINLEKEGTKQKDWTLTTGYKYKFKVEDLEKGDQIYIYWEPTTSGDYIYLNEITDMYTIS